MNENSELCTELKREKIARLWSAEVPTAEIVRLTGCTPRSVNATVSAMRRAGRALPRRRGVNAVIEPLGPELIAAASKEAARRGLSLQELASRILIAVLTDRMVNAVLDDLEAS